MAASSEKEKLWLYKMGMICSFAGGFAAAAIIFLLLGGL
jgi:hypothetical protein